MTPFAFKGKHHALADNKMDHLLRQSGKHSTEKGFSPPPCWPLLTPTGVPWPCTDFSESMEDAVSDIAWGTPRASFEDILKFQRCAINTTF